MSKIKGNDVLLFAAGNAIAGAKSCEIELECDLIETSSPTSGEFRSYISSRKGWSASGSFLLDDSLGFSSMVSVGQTYTIQVGKVTAGTRTLGADKVSGSAICTYCKITATRGNITQMSLKFQGTGALALPS